MLDWINELSPTHPHQAYHLTQLLTETYGISGKKADSLSPIQTKLAADPGHKSYHEGIMESHDFGVGVFGTFAISGTGQGLNDKGHASKAERLAGKIRRHPLCGRHVHRAGETRRQVTMSGGHGQPSFGGVITSTRSMPFLENSSQ